MSGDAQNEQSVPGPELVPVAAAAIHFGITERAVRKRIAAGTLRGVMIDRAWHVQLAEPAEEPEQGRGSAGSRNRNSSGPVPPTSSAVQQPATAIMQEWIAPLAARIEALARENGELEADLRHERERRELAEAEIERLRASQRPGEDESPVQTPNPLAGGYPAPRGAGEAERASERRRGSWLRRFLGWK